MLGQRQGDAAPLLLPRPRDPRPAAVVESLPADPADGALAAMARRAGTSERTLSRLCRDDAGLTYPQPRTRVRLLAALVLLADGETVAAAAHRSGWAKTHTFIGAVLGTTPGRHRRNAVSGVPAGPSGAPRRMQGGSAGASGAAERGADHLLRIPADV